MNHKLTNGMKMWKGNGNTITLSFSLKGLEILHQERRGQAKTLVMEHFNGILFHEYGPDNKQHTNLSIKFFVHCHHLVGEVGTHIRRSYVILIVNGYV